MLTPKLVDGLIVKQVDANGWVINKTISNTYLELNQYEYFIFEQINGKHDVEEIAAYFLERFNFLGHTIIHDTIEKLSKFGLIEQRLAIKQDEFEKYFDVQKKILAQFVFKFSRPFFSKSNEKISHFLGKFIFFPPILIFTSIFNIASLLFYIYFIPQYQFSLFTFNDSYVAGFWINLLIVLSLFSIRGFSFALMLGYFKRKIIETGVKFYVIFPVLFVNSSDILLEPHKNRRKMYFAPLSIIATIAGSSTFLSIYYPDFFFKIATISYIFIFLSISPFWNSDGIKLLNLYQLSKRTFTAAKKMFTLKKYPEEETKRGNIAILSISFAIVWITIMFQIAASLLESDALLAFQELLLAKTFAIKVATIISIFSVVFLPTMLFLMTLAYLYYSFFKSAISQRIYYLLFVLHFLIYFILLRHGVEPIKYLFLFIPLIFAVIISIQKLRTKLQFDLAIKYLSNYGFTYFLIFYLFGCILSFLFATDNFYEFEGFVYFGIIIFLFFTFFKAIKYLPGILGFFWIKSFLAVVLLGLSTAQVLDSGLFAFDLALFLILASFWIVYIGFIKLNNLLYVKIAHKLYCFVELDTRDSQLELSKKIINDLLSYLCEIIGVRKTKKIFARIHNEEQQNSDNIKEYFRQIFKIFLNIFGKKNSGYMLNRILRNYPLDISFKIRMYICELFGNESPLEKIYNNEKELINEIKGVPLFSVIEEDKILNIMSFIMSKEYNRSEKIIKQGDIGTKFFAIQKGRVAVEKEDSFGFIEEVATLEKGDCFGEISLIKEVPRTASVVATEDVEAYYLDKSAFLEFIINDKKIGDRITAILRNLIVLEHTDLFKGLSGNGLFQLAVSSNNIETRENDIIIMEGEEGDYFYVICDGSFKVTKKEKDGEKIIKILKKGEYFGELALIRRAKRSATVVCESNGALIKMDKEVFIKALDKKASLFTN